MFSGGTSNTIASLYTGFRVLRLVEVFLFFSLRPSHIRDTFTYGSGERFKDDAKMLWRNKAMKANTIPTTKHNAPHVYVERLLPPLGLHPPEAPVISMALRFLALIMVMVSLPAVGR